MSTAGYAPAEQGLRGEPSGSVDTPDARSAREVNVFKVDRPEFFDLPDVVALFNRAFTGKNARFKIDPDEIRLYMRDHINDAGEFNGRSFLLWVAHDPESSEFVGFNLCSYAPWPMCPNFCIAQFHVELPVARDPLIARMFSMVLLNGLRYITVINQTQRPDAVHKRLFRKFAKGTVVGSQITWEAEAARPKARDHGVRSFRVENPAFFKMPEVVAMFDRAFTGKNEKFEIDPNEMRRYLGEHIEDPSHWLTLWSAHHPERGFEGFVLCTYTPWPLCPNLCVGHLHADVPYAREPLMNSVFDFAKASRIDSVTVTNGSGRSDALYKRLFRKYGKGTVIGSVIVYDLEERHGRDNPAI